MNRKKLIALTMAAMMMISSVALAEDVCTPSDLPMVTEAPTESEAPAEAPVESEAPTEAPAEPETLDVTVTVVWQDGSNARGLRPEKVLVSLNGSDGSSQLVEVKEKPPVGEPEDESDPFNRWRYTFHGMPKMAGDVEIAYTVEASAPEGYRFEAMGMNAYLTLVETEEATTEPTEVATAEPVAEPTAEPTVEPIEVLTAEPTMEPTAEPTAEPTEVPTIEATMEPAVEATVEPTVEPTAEPTVEPTEVPTAEPTMEPAVEPTIDPTAEPTEVATEAPAATPTPTPVITYERDENGQLVLDENGQPMAIVPEGMEVPTEYVRDGNGILVLDIHGNPIPLNTIPEGGKKLSEIVDEQYHDRSIDVYAVYEGEFLNYGDTITLISVLNGYNGLVYQYQWQEAAVDGEWYDLPEAKGAAYSFVLTEENALYQWRIAVTITDLCDQ